MYSVNIIVFDLILFCYSFIIRAQLEQEGNHRDNDMRIRSNPAKYNMPDEALYPTHEKPKKTKKKKKYLKKGNC